MTRLAYATDRGPRENLEDAVSAFVLRHVGSQAGEGSALFVLDGVGGTHGGEVASATGAKSLSASLAASLAAGPGNAGPFPPDMVLDLLEWSFLQANEAILRQASEHPELKGMATTAVCALVVNGVLYVAWLGDSRAFLFSGGRLRQLTQDHSEVQRLVNAGLLEAAQARFHPAAHVIYRYLGSKEGFSPSTQTCRISAGDVILLCTDGMTDVLDDQEIAAHIQSCKAGQYPFDDLPRRLARQALEAGTGDNVTVLCCEYSPEPISEPRSFGRTLTGAYPAELAKALHHLAKENRHVQESLIITENQPRARGGRDCQRAGTPALPGLFSRP